MKREASKKLVCNAANPRPLATPYLKAPWELTSTRYHCLRARTDKFTKLETIQLRDTPNWPQNNPKLPRYEWNPCVHCVCANYRCYSVLP